MNFFYIPMILLLFLGCAQSSKNNETLPEKKIKKEVVLAKPCPVKAIPIIDFGTAEETSRVYHRLRLKAKSPFTVSDVSQIKKPFGYYSSKTFPGDAIYTNHLLCDLSEPTNECTINLEFKPVAVSKFLSKIKVSYTDSLGNDCSFNVSLKGSSTPTYRGKDTSN